MYRRIGSKSGQNRVRIMPPRDFYRVHTKGVMQPHATLRRVLRRFSNSKCFLEGFLEGACKAFFGKDKVLRRVLRRERFIEGA